MDGIPAEASGEANLEAQLVIAADSIHLTQSKINIAQLHLRDENLSVDEPRLAPRAGYLGQRCEAYFIGRPGERDPYLAFPEGISKAQGNRRLDLLARMNSRGSKKMSSAELKATEISINDAVNLMKSPVRQWSFGF